MMSRINYVSNLPTGISSLLSFGSNFSNLSANTVSKSSKSSKAQKEDSDVSLEVKEDKETKNTNKNKEADKEKVTKAKEDIDKGLEDLKEKQKKWSQENNNSICAINNQFGRQSIIVDALKDLSKSEIEALIDEYGVEDFVRTVFEPLLWQAGKGTNSDDLKAVRHIIDYEIDESYRSDLKKHDAGYKKQIDIAEDMNKRDNVSDHETMVFWL